MGPVDRSDDGSGQPIGMRPTPLQPSPGSLCGHPSRLHLTIRERVRAIADDHGTTMARVAIAWVLSRPAICSPITSAATLEQLDNNVDALNLQLTPQEISSLEAMYRPRGVVNDYVVDLLLRHLGGVLSEAVT